MVARLIIKDIIKTNLAVSAAKAQYIEELLKEKVDNQEEVILDFSGIRSLTSAFLNIGVGKLYGTQKEQYEQTIKIDETTLTPLQLSKYELVLENSSSKRSENYSAKIDEVILRGYTD